MSATLLARGAAFMLCLALMGCGTTAGERAIYDQVLRRNATPQPDAQFTALNQRGAEAIVISVEARDRATLFVRQSARDSAVHWISPDLIGVTTQQGFVTSTRGLGADLMSAEITPAAKLVLARRAGRAERHHGYLDGNEKIEIRSFICDISRRGPRQVDLGARNVATELMQESCTNPSFQFENLYWVATETGEIIQSRQWISEALGPLALRKIIR